MLIPQSLTILTTSRCSASCDHCCMNSGPSRTDVLDGQTVTNVISDLHKRSPLKVVVFAGGEPTLAKGALHAGIQHCRKLGITSRLVTNASWATSFPKARKMIERLRASGLNEINFSADDYHLPDVPFENVIRAWKVSKCVGFSGVIVANGAAPGSFITPSYIMEQLTETLPTRFSDEGLSQMSSSPASDGTVYGISNSRYQRLGRAKDFLPEHSFQDADYFKDLSGGCPHAVQSPALSPQGHLLSCCGFELEGNGVLDFGAAGGDRASNRIEAANADPIVRAIAYLGPAFLKEVVEQVAPKIEFPKSFGSMCEVCQSVVGNTEAIEALRENVNLLSLATNTVVRRLEKQTA